MRTPTTFLRPSLSTRTARLAGGALAFAALAAGCSSATSGPGEQTGEAASAIVQRQQAVIDQTDVELLTALTEVKDSTLEVHEGQGLFTASKALAQASNVSSESFFVDHVDISTPWPLPDLTVWPVLIVADMPTFSAQMAGDHVAATISLHGKLHVSTSHPWPDADIVIDQATLQMNVTVDAAGHPVLQNLTANIQDHVTNCGIVPYCGTLIQDALPSMDDRVASVLAKKLSEVFARPATAAALQSTLLRYYNALPANDVGPGRPAWTLVQPTDFAFASGQLTFDVTRVLPPVAPTGCAPSTPCSNIALPPTVQFHCSGTPETLELEVLGADGTYKIVDQNPNAMDDATVGDGNPPFGKTGTYRVCTTNAAGTACAAPVQVDVPPANSCNPGGGGHGPSQCDQICPVCEAHGGTCVPVGRGCRCE